MAAANSDARKRLAEQGQHHIHWDPEVRELVAREVAAAEALWDDRLCDALAAARLGSYDGLTVEQHLESLLARLGGAA